MWPPAHGVVSQRTDGHELEDLVGDRAVGTQLGAASRAAPQMKFECIGRTIRVLAVRQLRQCSCELIAAAALLDVGEDLQEPLPALRHTAVDLCIGPASDLSDLGVGVALCLESQGADLLWLQRVQCLTAADDPLAPGEAVVWARALRRDGVEEVSVVITIRPRNARGAEKALPLTTHRQGLTLGDRLHPPDQGVTLDPRRLGEQDLEGTLICVLTVVGADRIAARGAPEDGVMSPDQRFRGTAARLGGGDCLSGLICRSSVGPGSTGCFSQ